MQKKLLGMAVAAALAAPATVALAQSTVQVYGTAHMSLNSTRYGQATDGTSAVRKFAVNSHASNFGIRSSESLGGGLTGWVQYEFNVKMERDNDLTGANGSSRNTGIGVRGAWGNAYLGTWETPWAQTFRLWDVGTIGGYGPTTSIVGRRETTGSQVSANCVNAPLGGTVGTPTTPTAICYHAESSNAGAYPLWRRYGSAFFYESPMFGGAQIKWAWQPNETKTASNATIAGTTVVNEDPSSWSASLTWTGMGGNARAFFAMMRSDSWTRTDQTDNGWTIGGGYNFGAVNVGAAFERYTYKTVGGDSRARQWGLGLSVPVGAGKVGASLAAARDINGGSLAGDNGAKMWNLGYEHGLSKRTAIGVGIAKIDNDSAAAFTWTGMAPSHNGVSVTNLSGADVSNLFVSIRHSF
jgi:predicted porin